MLRVVLFRVILGRANLIYQYFYLDVVKDVSFFMRI